METYTRFAVTPWRNSHELIQLRRDLYRLNDDNADRRQAGVNKVLAWRARKESLPLLLDSTADIVDVILQDESGGIKQNASRLLYATAISRFITGYLDTQIDLTRDRPSWFPPGKSLQPPSSLLEVRHCIVHRHMPSLAELKRAAKQALDWLWEWYWSHLEAAFGLPPSLPSTASALDVSGLDVGVVAKLQNILKTYVKGRKQEIKSKRRLDLCTAASMALSTYKLRFSTPTTTMPDAATQTSLLHLLVEDLQILPTDKKIGSSMSGAFLVWTPLLLEFENKSKTFFTELLTTILKEMNNTDKRDEEREGMCEWAAHMLTSPDWQGARGGKERAMKEEVLGDCMTELGAWNLRLAEKVVGSMDKAEGELWRAILDASSMEADDSVMVLDQGVEPEETQKEEVIQEDVEQTLEVRPVGNEETKPAIETNKTKPKIKGPQKVVGLWKPKPIGWLPDGWDEDA